MKVKKVKETLPMPTEDDAFEQEVMEAETPKQEPPKVETPPVVYEAPKKKRGRPRKTEAATKTVELPTDIVLEYQTKKRELTIKYEAEQKTLAEKYKSKLSKIMGL